MLTQLLGNKLFLAPIEPELVRRVVDIGCGTGIWPIDFADAHPDAQVEGVDLSPIQPTWVPPNCHFVVEDVEDDWTYPVGHFDFVHIRCLMGAIRDWKRLYRQAFERLKPGGWIQHLDMSISFTSDDGSLAEDHMMRRWSQTFIHCGERIGKTFLIASKAAEWIREVGFEDVQEKWYKVPVGTWPKDEVCCALSPVHVNRSSDLRRLITFPQNLKAIGSWNYHYCDTGAEGQALYLLTSVLGWSVESCQVFIAEFRTALNDRRNHAYYHV